MPSKYVEGAYPIYLEMGRGAYVFNEDGNRFIDYPLGLGAVLLGHANEYVNRAVQRRLNSGTLFVCPSILETELAQKIKDMIPCAQMCRFLKTGSEATSAAIKIARAHTGRDHIAYCGYHGWHDWYTIATPKNKGIPSYYRSLIHGFEFNNIESLREIIRKYQLACIILEPFIFEEPKDDFLKKIRKIATEEKIVLIFDEVVTGFRSPGYSAQKMFKVTPDIATFGKNMGNGIPISCVCGKSKYMKELEGDCFVSSTFGGDLVGISAAIATLDIIRNEPVIDNIFYFGEYLKTGYNEIAKSLGVDTECKGYPNRTFFTFPTAEHKSLFWQECIAREVFFGWANFISYAHGLKEIEATLSAVKKALSIVKENWDNPSKALRGKVATEVFRLVATRR